MVKSFSFKASQAFVLGLAVLGIVVVITFVTTYRIFDDTSAEIKIASQMQSARIVDQALKSYFQSLKILTENTVLHEAFNPDDNLAEENLRTSIWNPDRANEAVENQGIVTILEGPKSEFKPVSQISNALFAWQIFKGLPAYDINGKPIGMKRRYIARNILKSFPDVHYVFEMDIDGNLVFLEPYEIQKNITSYNYEFRDYLALVKKLRRTVVSEGYISHDQNRTQIITVATPIFDSSNQIKKVFAASVSASTIRDKVFYSIKSNMDVEDGTIFYLIDRHGHVVASSSGENTYFPMDGKGDDSTDQGNIRHLALFEGIKWENDTLEKGNIWERTTKSWVVSSLKKDYSARYKNYGGLEVFASFYPTSVLGDDDKKWGILIETPAAQIFAQKAKLRAVFLISAVLIGSLLIFLAFYILRNIARTERALAKQEEKTKMIVRQVAHDVQSPITALDILWQTFEGNEQQKKLLKTTIGRLKEITQDLKIKKTNESNSDHGCAYLKKIIESIITEKRIEFKRRFPNVELILQNEVPSAIVVGIDGAILKRVISNIMNNGAEAIGRKENGRIEVRCKYDEENVLIDISDNGRGIEKRYLSHVFERGTSFFKTGGSGLGLSYAKDVIEHAGGVVSISSSEGQGTSVLLKIPRDYRRTLEGDITATVWV